MIKNFLKEAFDFLVNSKERYADDVLEGIAARKEAPIRIAVAGKTHAGKSTLINLLFKPKPKLKVGVGRPGTMKPFTGGIELKLGKDRGTLIYTDLPGIGSDKRNKKFIEETNIEHFEKCDIILWLFRCKDTAKEVEQEFYEGLNRRIKKKIVFGLSQVDEGGWYNKGREPSKKQKIYIMNRIHDICESFNIREDEIIEFSARKNYRVDLLVKKLILSIKDKGDILRHKIVHDLN